MKKIIAFFLERPLLVNLISIAVLIVGGLSLYGLQKETFPPIDFNYILISTTYPGSSPEDVEKLITIPMERKIKSVDGIKDINAISSEGSSIIYLEVLADADLDTVLDDTKNAIDLVTDLPNDADIPIVRSLNNKRRPIIKVTLTGDDYVKLKRTSKKLRDDLESIDGVAVVDLNGYRVDEVRIEVDPDKLNKMEVTVGEIYQAVRQRNLNLSAGKIEDPKGEIIVRTVAEFEGIEDIENVVVISNNSGRRIHIKDIAKVRRVPQKSGIIQRSNGKQAIFLNVKARKTADILDTAKAIKDKTKEFFVKEDVEGLEYRFTDDISYYVSRRLDVLKDNGIMGMILVFVTLMLFLNFKTSLITSLGAPVAFMVAFTLMDVMGLSVNLMSMFALILVLGMLVDDSIIVAEYYYQKLEEGLSPREAARYAAFNTIKPVFATVATTMVAFGSLFFMGGIMGKFLWPVPAVVMICLLASLFECFFILPSHLSDYCRIDPKHQAGRRWYDSLTNFYAKILKKVLKYPWTVLVIFAFILGGSLFMATKMSFELFPGDDVRTVFLQIKGKVGTPLEETGLAVKKLEDLSLTNLKKEELDQIKAQVGVFVGKNGDKKGSHYGSLILYLTPPGDRERSTDEILKTLSRKASDLLPNWEVTTTKVQGGPRKGKALDIQLTSPSLEHLKDASQLVQKALLKKDGIIAPEIDFEKGKQQIIVNVIDAQASRLGLSTQQIALEVRRLLSGDSITEIRESDEDIEIKIFLEDGARSKIDSLMKLHLVNGAGRRIPFERVVKLTKRPGAFVIRRLDRKRVISVTASINKKVTTPVAVAKEFGAELKTILKDFSDVSWTFGGENKDTKESMLRLSKSGIMAISAIFIILVIMFNSILHPIVVMSAIPLGLIGVVWTFKIAHQSLGFMALMGVVALVGVVVNDSIVLVTFINETRQKVDDLYEAVWIASKSRFRAVILTTFTTVAGLLPIAHPSIARILSFGTNTDSDPFIQPMALSFAWGLLFASLVTLFFVPCNYIAFERMKMRLKNLKNKMKGNATLRKSDILN